MPVQHFIRDSDNLIKLTLTEDDEAITGAWSELDIYIGNVHIHRTADGDGVSLDTSTGLLTISPGDLTTDEKAELALLRRWSYKTQIVVTSVLNDDGAVFGGDGSETLYFNISDKPA